MIKGVPKAVLLVPAWAAFLLVLTPSPCGAEDFVIDFTGHITIVPGLTAYVLFMHSTADRCSETDAQLEVGHALLGWNLF